MAPGGFGRREQQQLQQQTCLLVSMRQFLLLPPLMQLSNGVDAWWLGKPQKGWYGHAEHNCGSWSGSTRIVKFAVQLNQSRLHIKLVVG